MDPGDESRKPEPVDGGRALLALALAAAPVPFAGLQAGAGSDHPVPDVGKRMRCTACGSRKIRTVPELYPGGIEAMRARWGGKPRSAGP